MNIKQKRELEEEIGLGTNRTKRRYSMRKPRKGFGLKDGSRHGFKSGGRGRNRTSTCRHPKIKKSRR